MVHRISVVIIGSQQFSMVPSGSHRFPGMKEGSSVLIGRGAILYYNQ